MIGSNIKLVECPKEWESRPYSDFFEHLLFERNLLCICIFRTPAKEEQEEADKKSSDSEMIIYRGARFGDDVRSRWGNGDNNTDE
jgi:hypothetical protein